MYEACVIGCGQIGSEVLRELANVFSKENVAGVDISKDIIEELSWSSLKVFTPEQMPQAKVYIISLWTMDSIKETVRNIGQMQDCGVRPLIFIESTIDPNDLMGLMLDEDIMFFNGVIFPHRWMENDPEHGIFNQARAIGAWSDWAKTAAKEFLGKVMDPGLLYWTSPKVACLSKVVENSYRAMEIIIAQEIKQAVNKHGISFEELRRITNTKWNINIKEAKDGVKKKCLPKDLAFFNKYFDNNMIFKLGEMLNKSYIDEHRT